MENEKKTDIEESKHSSHAKKPNRKKMIFYCIFFVCLAILVVTVMVNIGDISQMGETFLTALQGENVIWLILAMTFALIYFIAYPTPLMLLSKKLGLKAKMFDVWTIGASEHFYNGVTPSNAGGQPFQIYALTSCNMTAPEASGTILLNYINICLCSNIWGLVSLIYFPSYVADLSNMGGSNLSGLGVIALLGIILNVLNLLFFIFIGVSEKFRKAFVRFFYFVCKWRILGKRIKKYGPKLDSFLVESQKVFKNVRKHKGAFVHSILIRMAFLAVFYSANFFIMKAAGCNITAADYPKVLLATAFATVCVSWFPTPGAVGAGELVGAIVIASVGGIEYSSGTAVSLLWRTVSFYLILLLSLIITFIFDARLNRRLAPSKAEIEGENKEKPEDEHPAENK